MFRKPITATLLRAGILLAGLATLSSLAAADANAPKAHSLLDLVILAGPIEYLLICLSVISYGLALNWTFTLKREILVPDRLVDEVYNTFDAENPPTDEDIEALRNSASADNSMLGNTIAAILDNKELGFESMRDSMDVASAAERNRYISKVSWLSMFASSATLGGLLGTVSGIIGSFLKMSANPGGVDPNMLAANIGEALVCTATGLGVAIGNLYFFFWLRGRVNQCALDTAVIANEVLDYFRPR